MEQAEATPSRSRDRRLDVLFVDHYLGIKRLATLLTSDEDLGQDLAQEAMVRTWRRLDDIEVGAELAYVRTTLVNLVRRSFRRRALGLKNRAIPRDEVARTDTADRIDILAAMRRLPPRQRACVALRYLEDLTETQTAMLLKVSTGTVKSQTHAGLHRLREILGEP